MADTLPFLKFILVKKSLMGVDSLRFPIALAAFRRAIFNLMLSFCIFLEIILPPVFLLSGDSLRKDVNCLAFWHFLIPSSPTSLIRVRRVEKLKPSVANKSTLSKYWYPIRFRSRFLGVFLLVLLCDFFSIKCCLLSSELLITWLRIFSISTSHFEIFDWAENSGYEFPWINLFSRLKIVIL